MLIDLPHKPHPSIHHYRAVSTSNEAEINMRGDRLLLVVFAQHLNATINSIQDCLQDLEQHPKLKTYSQKQQTESNLKHLFYQHSSKLCKEINYRNRDISRRYHQFYTLYYSVIKPPSIKTLLKKQKQIIKQQVKHQRNYTQQESKYEYTSIQRQKLSLYNGLRLEVINARAKTHDKIQGNIQDGHTMRTFQFDTHEHQCTLKVKESLSKFIQMRQQHHRADYLEYYPSEHQKKMIQTSSLQNQQELNLQHLKVINQPKGINTKRVLVFRNRIIGQTEISHSGLFNRSKNLCVSFVQPQGYRPRSKCLGVTNYGK